MLNNVAFSVAPSFVLLKWADLKCQFGPLKSKQWLTESAGNVVVCFTFNPQSSTGLAGKKSVNRPVSVVMSIALAPPLSTHSTLILFQIRFFDSIFK